jgi:prepilin-type N-terminal cleavage/methylation domain-containing protein
MIRRGFTLMELLVVISILLLLLGMLFPALNMVRNQARKSVSLQHISAIGNAVEAYNQQFRSYPSEQGVTWTGTTPAWDLAMPSEHRECISTSATGAVGGLADLLAAQADLRIPGEALAKSGPIAGFSRLADGWGQPLRYQRFDELVPGVLASRAQFWFGLTVAPAAAGLPGQRRGFVVYSVGAANLAPARIPSDPAADTSAQPGSWWNDAKKLIYRSAGS